MAHVRQARSGQGWESRYRDPSGRERSRTFATRREAQRFSDRQSADVQRGEYRDPRLSRLTIGHWANVWFATTIDLKPNTRAGYESILCRHVVPAFGERGVAGISRADVANESGGPMRHNLFYARHFKPAVRAAGLPDRLRFHDLRHTCAALLIAQGAHPRAIMERLGHSSIQVTIDRYGHLLPSLDQTLVDGLEDTYRNSLGDDGSTVRMVA